MNIFPFKSSIKLKDRYTLNRHRSGFLWFTGLSGSGKSTLAHAMDLRGHIWNSESRFAPVMKSSLFCFSKLC